MIAHIAEAGEGRGRVVLRFSVGDPSPVAISAAVKLAQAFESEIESLFIEDTEVMELASHSFVREISFSGSSHRQLTARGLHGAFQASFCSARQCLEVAASAAGVPLYQRVVRDEPVHAIASACAQKGPWNVVALAEPFGANAAHTIQNIFDNVTDATGLVLVGPSARRTTGPVIVVVEDLERLHGMLRAAERIGKLTDSPTTLLLLGDNAADLEKLDGEVRLMLGDHEDVKIAEAVEIFGEPAVAAEALRRLHGGFVITRFGGLAVPSQGGWRPLISALECPLLLVR